MLIIQYSTVNYRHHGIQYISAILNALTFLHIIFLLDLLVASVFTSNPAPPFQNKIVKILTEHLSVSPSPIFKLFSVNVQNPT